MTLVTKATFKTPVVRVFDKDANISFYQETLGFRLVSEENAIAIFSAYENSERTFIIEESPTYRTRAVNGKTKHHKTIIKVTRASDIECLLARDITVDTLFKGENGYAFEVTSPQGYTYLIHAENDRASLVTIEKTDFKAQPDFLGLSDFTIEELVLNVPNVGIAQAFYRKLNLSLAISFVESEGEDLQVNPDDVWDLEYLEFTLPVESEIALVKEELETLGCAIAYDDKKLLVTRDTSNIEIWFSKS
ncbi:MULTISPECIES: CppA N-terminal domain-containing protein [Streptococcus]|uniref:CppA N-terminal domain-containing protein n=1 Tax=Streptococcus caledonicus TaxID=2614158 RepID=A0ABW0UFM3_9STRE|nr:CppA N-terminal domain-containing protein [Streptococcus sp. S784/96/1]